MQAFADTLSAQDSIGAHLPFYVESLPYYQRMMATALASSLQKTMPYDQRGLAALLNGDSSFIRLSANVHPSPSSRAASYRADAAA